MGQEANGLTGAKTRTPDMNAYIVELGVSDRLPCPHYIRKATDLIFMEDSYHPEHLGKSFLSADTRRRLPKHSEGFRLLL
jgi:hypothetical protein